MNTWFELWDTESANLVASYDTWTLTLEKLQKASAKHSTSWFDHLALVEEHDNESDPTIVAEGRAILDVIRLASVSP